MPEKLGVASDTEVDGAKLLVGGRIKSGVGVYVPKVRHGRKGKRNNIIEQGGALKDLTTGRMDKKTHGTNIVII